MERVEFHITLRDTRLIIEESLVGEGDTIDLVITNPNPVELEEGKCQGNIHEMAINKQEVKHTSYTTEEEVLRHVQASVPRQPT